MQKRERPGGRPTHRFEPSVFRVLTTFVEFHYRTLEPKQPWAKWVTDCEKKHLVYFHPEPWGNFPIFLQPPTTVVFSHTFRVEPLNRSTSLSRPQKNNPRPPFEPCRSRGEWGWIKLNPWCGCQRWRGGRCRVPWMSQEVSKWLSEK